MMTQSHHTSTEPVSKSPSKRRVTLADVALDAGVSRATASLVLRGSPLVAEATAERVQASMAKLGYVYNRAAANLRAQQTHTVGLAVTDITNPFFAELAVCIEDALDEAGYTVLLTHTADQVDKQARQLNVLHGFHVDGLVWCPAQATPPELAAQLHEWKLPFVLVARDLPESQADYVGADNIKGAAMAVEHLVARGHLRIAFVGGPAASTARQDRVEGYRQALIRRGLPCDDAWNLTSSVTREGGFSVAHQLLRLPDPPTAAVCYNDVVAFGVLLGLQAAGRHPGTDFGVVGFDDIADAALVEPALTTIALPPKAIGTAAVGSLLDRLAVPTRPTERIYLAPKLVVRAST